jgi:hypothetical protein
LPSTSTSRQKTACDLLIIVDEQQWAELDELKSWLTNYGVDLQRTVIRTQTHVNKTTISSADPNAVVVLGKARGPYWDELKLADTRPRKANYHSISMLLERNLPQCGEDEDKLLLFADTLETARVLAGHPARTT